MNRAQSLTSYAYLAALAVVLIGLNVLTAEDSSMHPDSVEEVMYLIVAASLLTLIEVRLERGRLTLSALANGAAAVVLLSSA